MVVRRATVKIPDSGLVGVEGIQLSFRGQIPIAVSAIHQIGAVLRRLMLLRSAHNRVRIESDQVGGVGLAIRCASLGCCRISRCVPIVPEVGPSRSGAGRAAP